jgi:hypothetical protein
MRLRPVRPAEVVRWAAIRVDELNLGIHAHLTPMHLRERPYIGALFIVGKRCVHRWRDHARGLAYAFWVGSVGR